jgi:hypothetical protein
MQAFLLHCRAVSTNVVIDLSAKTASEVDGTRLLFTSSTHIEVLFAGDGHDKLIAHDAGSLILGGRGNDLITGGKGDDYLEGGQGNDEIDGGLGKDTAIYRISRDEVKLEEAKDGWIVSAAGDKDTVKNVEMFAFKDGLLTFDVMDSDAAKVYRLYEATFGRNPDEAGLVHWTKVAMSGESLQALADGFVASTEFAVRYGQNVSNQQFVAQLYKNVLGRDGDLAEIDHWAKAIVHGLSREDALVGFSESAEHKMIRAEELKHGIWLPSQDWLQ